MAQQAPRVALDLRPLADIQPEPLSEARWKSIEQAVFSRLERGEASRSAPLEPPIGRRHVVTTAWASVIAAAAVIVATLLWFSGDEQALSRISTGASASRVMLPGVALDVGPESAVVVSGSASESQLLVLDRGEVTCDVDRRRAGAPFVVQAGGVKVEVIGTRFRVVREGERARVSVQEGVVKVSAGGSSVRLVAGQTWPAEPSVQAPAPSSSSADSARSTLDAEQAPAPVRPRASARPAEGKQAPLTRSLQARFEAAARLEARDAAESIRLYRELEGGSSSWAQNALFAHGRLEAARGNRAEARRVLRQYLARFPKGANASDARNLLLRME